MRREYDATLGLNTAAEEHSVNNSNYTLNARENTQSVTIDITDTMFLVTLEESERHHSTKPIVEVTMDYSYMPHMWVPQTRRSKAIFLSHSTHPPRVC